MGQFQPPAPVVSIPPSRRVGATAALRLFTLLLAPTLLLFFLFCEQPKFDRHRQNICLCLAAIGAAVGLFAWLCTTRWLGHKRNTFALICLSVGLLMAGTIVWNRAFRSYADNHKFLDLGFRPAFRTLHSPVYGRNLLVRSRDPNPNLTIQRFQQHGREITDDINDRIQHHGRKAKAHILWTTLAGAAGLLLLLGVFFVYAMRSRWLEGWRVALPLLMVLQLAITVLVGWSDTPDRLTEPGFANYTGFFGDAEKMQSTRQILRQWVELMPKMGVYDDHYPPGNMLLIFWSERLGMPNLAKIMVMLATALTLLPLAGLCRELELDRRATALALVLFATAAGTVAFPTVSPSPLVMLPGTVALWLWVRSLRRGGYGAAVGTGATLALFTFFSLTVVLIFILIAVVTLLGWWNGNYLFAGVVKRALVAAVAFIGCFILLDLVTGFNIWQCVWASVLNQQIQRGYGYASESLTRYLLRSSGQVLAYLIMSGLALSTLACSAGTQILRHRSPAALFAAALLLSILISGFSTLFVMETERVWLALTPALALAAGYELHRRAENEGKDVIAWVLPLCFIITTAQNLVFQPYGN